MYRSLDKNDWRALLKQRVKDREEECHVGCGDPATVLRLTGKRTGAWCSGCFRELTEGYVPKLDPPKGCKKRANRKTLMD